MEIIYKGKFDVRVYEISFKGSYYRVDFTKYKDCIDINSILYICDLIDKNKPENYKNRTLRTYETEYKQISILLKREVL